MRVFLTFWDLCSRRSRFPHARGGVSISIADPAEIATSSPRTWGVSRRESSGFCASLSSPPPWGCFPLNPLCGRENQVSPRLWGCFRRRHQCGRWADVFPTHVRVFPCTRTANTGGTGLPHLRGGVSPGSLRKAALLAFYPPSGKQKCARLEDVFPSSKGCSVHVSFY